jgi:hypothetical protein
VLDRARTCFQSSDGNPAASRMGIQVYGVVDSISAARLSLSLIRWMAAGRAGRRVDGRRRVAAKIT